METLGQRNSSSNVYGNLVTHKKGTLRDSLHKRAEETMTREGISNAVVCPDDVDRKEWIAVHAVDFYNDICVLYGIVNDACTTEACPLMSAGENFEFLWVDKQRYRHATRLPAKVYIDYLLNWLSAQLNDETLFPVDENTPFPSDYDTQVRSIFRRMYRVYAHIWCSHRDVIQLSNSEKSFKFSLTHYLFFVNQFDLVSGGDLRPLCALVNELAPKLPLTHAMNELEQRKQEQRSKQAAQPVVYRQLVAPISRSQSASRIYSSSPRVVPGMVNAGFAPERDALHISVKYRSSGNRDELHDVARLSAASISSFAGSVQSCGNGSVDVSGGSNRASETPGSERGSFNPYGSVNESSYNEEVFDDYFDNAEEINDYYENAYLSESESNSEDDQGKSCIVF